jgi:hypothetical protein
MKTVLVALLLSGCANFPAVQMAVAEHGADIADQELVMAEWGLCKAATVGAWMRKYGATPEKMSAWVVLCNYGPK